MTWLGEVILGLLYCLKEIEKDFGDGTWRNMFDNWLRHNTSYFSTKSNTIYWYPIYFGF